LAWSPLLIAGIVNRSRVTFIQTGNVSASRKGRVSKPLILLVCFVTSIFLALAGYGLLASSLTVAVGLVLPIGCAPFFGLQQGNGKINTQYLSSALAAVIGLMLTVVAVLSSFWESLKDQDQLFVLVSISVITNSVPYLLAFIKYRNSELVARPKDKIQLSFMANLQRLKVGTLESVATLPPILLGLVDVIAIGMFQENEDVISYGLTQRISVIAMFLTGALYLRESNKTIAGPNFEVRHALDRSLILVLKNIPFIALFTAITPWLVSSLSRNQAHASLELIGSFGLLAAGQAFWVIFSGYLYKTPSATQSLGKFVLYFLLPTSVSLTFVGAFVFGPSGPAIASLLCYIIAVVYSSRLSRKESGV
jgi:hypothetical protein